MLGALLILALLFKAAEMIIGRMKSGEPLGGLISGLFALVGFCVWQWLCRFCGQLDWLIVPGGLVHRRAGRLRSTWNLHVFDRRCSLLIAYHESADEWKVTVADELRQETLSANDEQVRCLLSAWLSPIAPPKAEQLADWQ